MASFMDMALEEARAAGERGEVPVGCVIVRDGEVVARAGNRTLADRDPTAHAEIVAIRRGRSALGSERLADCDLYVTLEPCAMCAGAVVVRAHPPALLRRRRPEGRRRRQRREIFCFADLSSPARGLWRLAEAEASALLKNFFKERR